MAINTKYRFMSGRRRRRSRRRVPMDRMATGESDHDDGKNDGYHFVTFRPIGWILNKMGIGEENFLWAPVVMSWTR